MEYWFAITGMGISILYILCIVIGWICSLTIK